jgi:ribosomal-protein-serine acetyltransferase
MAGRILQPPGNAGGLRGGEAGHVEPLGSTPVLGGRGEAGVPICRLRPYASTDAGALFEAARESTAEVYPWLPWCHPGYSLAEAEQWARSRAELGSGEEYNFVILGPDDRFLGGCGLNQINRTHRFANLGYWVRSSATGRGVATEVVRQLEQFAFEHTDLVRLEIICAVANERSQRVAERAGAQREGVLRSRLLLHGRAVDAVMYSLVRSQTSVERIGRSPLVPSARQTS